MKGLVMKSTGSWYRVRDEHGNLYDCRVRGRIRLEGFKETNPVAVGDFVEFELENEAGAITAILQRTNHIVRKSVKKTGHSHVLAANLSQAMLLVTPAYPRTSPGFIDRFLVTAEAYNIPQVLVFNKLDILDGEAREAIDFFIRIYTDIGIRCLKTIALDDDQSAVLEILRGNTTVVAGVSGVGKSTLLNKISPHIKQKVGALSDFSDKGTHVTTVVEMFALDENTFVIDTPGVKEWGLVNISREELSDNFPEMRDLRSSCKFGYRCLHIEEPKCAVIGAAKEGRIALSRYESYVSMLFNEDNRK